MSRNKKLDEKLMVKLYNNGKTSTEIAGQLRCSPQVVCTRLKENGIQVVRGERNRIQFSTDAIAKIVRWYQINHKMIQWIANQYGCCVTTIRNLLDAAGVERHGTNRKYFFNQDYFREIDTPNKAYWLGLFYTDGNVSGTTFSLGLQRQDKYVLKRLAAEVGYTGQITDYIQTRAINGNPSKA